MSRIGQQPLDLNRFKQAQFGSSAGSNNQKSGSAQAQGLKRLQETGAGANVQAPKLQQVSLGQSVQRPDALQGAQGLSKAALNKFAAGGTNQMESFKQFAQGLNPNAPAAGGAAVGKGVQLPNLFA